jgi:hypothetical protein
MSNETKSENKEISKDVKKTSGEELKGEIGKKYRLLVQILTSDPR